MLQAVSCWGWREHRENEIRGSRANDSTLSMAQWPLWSHTLSLEPDLPLVVLQSGSFLLGTTQLDFIDAQELGSICLWSSKTHNAHVGSEAGKRSFVVWAYSRLAMTV